MAVNFTGIFIPALVSALFRSRLEGFRDPPKLFDQYDYIIIGSGPGGSVVANRLSEDPRVTVLLLEAGSVDNVTSQIPVLTMIMITDGYDWNYDSTPQQKACLGMKNGICGFASGKVVGGSTTIGVLLHMRGNKEDFDEWEKQGNDNWSYEDVLPFFKKSEDFQINGNCVEGDNNGCGGPLTVSNVGPEVEGKVTEYFMLGAKELGYKELDYNAENQIGVRRTLCTVRNGVRQSAATAFLRPIRKRTNLHIYLNSFVRKILIDPITKSAIGVEFENNGDVKTVKSNKEVILSAGVYSSPKILMLSGIGPKEELNKFDIPTIVDLPGVGQNLQEPLSYTAIFSTGKPLPSDRDTFINVDNIQKWYKGAGPLASTIGIDAYAFMKSKYTDKGPGNPDLLVLFQSLAFQNFMSPFLQRATRVTDKTFNELYLPHEDMDTLPFHVTLLRPKSRGTITLKSNNPLDPPIIEPRMLSEDRDLKVLAEGVQLTYQFLNTSAIRGKNYTLATSKLKECSQYDKMSNDYLLCELPYSAIPRWCGCCTNKMGPPTDKMAVVDHRLRVHGIRGLRVVDASIMPEAVAGYPVAPVYMIGEKAASMIKEDNRMR